MHDAAPCPSEKVMSHMNHLKRFGFKQTLQRTYILEVFLNMDGHPSPEEIHKELLRQGRKTGLATIYRMLKVLVTTGIARKLEFGDGQTRYEYRDDKEQHLHLICTRCGRIFETSANEVNMLFEQVAETHTFFLHTHATYLYGVCDVCLSAKKTPQDN